MSTEKLGLSPRYAIGDDLTLKVNEVVTEGTEQYVVRYDVFLPPDDDVVGHFDVGYHPGGSVKIDTVALFGNALGKGYGKELYKSVPDLPLPDGSNFRERECTFTSPMQSDSARRVWESLVRSGHAIKLGDKAYEML